MKTRTYFFIAVLIAIGASILGLLSLNQQETSDLPRTERIDWAEKAKKIASKDEEVQELVDGKPFSTSGRVYNETYTELFFRIGGEYEDGRLRGGKIYKIAIDLDKETVKSIKEETNNQTVLDWIEAINVTAQIHAFP